MKTKFSLLFSSLLLISLVFFMCQKEAVYDSEISSSRSEFQPSKKEIIEQLDYYFTASSADKQSAYDNTLSFAKNLNDDNLLYFSNDFHRRVMLKNSFENTNEFSKLLKVREEILNDFDTKCRDSFGKTYLRLTDMEFEKAYMMFYKEKDEIRIDNALNELEGNEFRFVDNCWKDTLCPKEDYGHTTKAEQLVHAPLDFTCIKNDWGEDCDTEFRFEIAYVLAPAQLCEPLWYNKDGDFRFWVTLMGGSLAVRSESIGNIAEYKMLLGKRFMNHIFGNFSWTTTWQLNNLGLDITDVCTQTKEDSGPGHD